ncbi:voltage-gated potassium channel [Allostreptomyces psammosilenae]|uniref:Voltage-gated potassium channel n=2 Tax=Allostreptomyces psammosilenae TaxID=1892865 RepID=A0A852ZXA3_9ACTN|nr:potassium channel family protein [Allostreptomyces psammosilenae]NYI05354.1 voltage-gated potassium channel [Allostreptomyces psammosilenae]
MPGSRPETTGSRPEPGPLPPPKRARLEEHEEETRLRRRAGALGRMARLGFFGAEDTSPEAVTFHGHRVEQSSQIVIPRISPGPLRQVVRRLAMAIGVLLFTTIIVWLDRDGYNDNAGGSLTFVDALYYSTVTLSTTGYGDITPASEAARLVNIFIVTPARVLFLIILVGTTLEVLTERTREQFRLSRWRSSLREHTVIVGYGTKGRSAVQTLVSRGVPHEEIVVVDPDPRVIEGANSDGLVGVVGDATRSEVLRRAEVQRARQVVVTAHRDDTAVLVTLTARQLNKRATVVVAVREEENVPLLRQSGATTVVTSSSAAGRLLGLSMLSPHVGRVMEDLLSYGQGLDLMERPVVKAEVGKAPRELPDLVVAVLRGHRLLNYDDAELGALQAADRLITVQRAEG